MIYMERKGRTSFDTVGFDHAPGTVLDDIAKVDHLDAWLHRFSSHLPYLFVDFCGAPQVIVPLLAGFQRLVRQVGFRIRLFRPIAGLTLPVKPSARLFG